MQSRLERAASAAASAWDRYWFADVAPHIYALLRILFGVLAFASLLGVRHLPLFWDLDGFVPPTDRGLGVKNLVLSLALEHVAGRVLFFGSLASYASMAVGFQSNLAVLASLAVSIAELLWNPLPLSAAYMVVQTVLFCLVWADCGSVWSVDAWLAKRRGVHLADAAQSGYPIAPLRLIRFQVALVYLNSGLWKLYDEHWRDGSAVHYVLSNNVYRRFPVQVPPSLDWLTTVLTYSVLFWELGFAFMIWYRPTRRIALLAGIAMHLGMTATIELGPFPWVMMASYVAFLDPDTVPSLRSRFRGLVARVH
jgi:hypothetical protein